MKVIKFLVVVITVSTLMSCNGQNSSITSLETELDSVSYAVGMDMAIKLKKNFSEVNEDAFVQGYKNGMDSLNLLLKEKDLNVILGDYFRKKQRLKAEELAAANAAKAELEFGELKRTGEKFIEENKSKEGVQITDSGLQYIVLKQGSGEKPKLTDRVKVHYHGTLIDGTVFDSSVDKGKPFETGVGQVIKGWIEGLQLMNVGSKYKFFIPQELAYGANPRPGGVIKPFSPLVFELELLEIK
ncbi:MAG: FKBP-type peptidyl-prolyl cis-trans isomerase [Porticoccaceae bacterium]|jgi:FKBP-type peptidyl-prolyl cis-trans isomerase FklB